MDATLTANGAGESEEHILGIRVPYQDLPYLLVHSLQQFIPLLEPKSGGCTGTGTVLLTVGITPTTTAVPNPSALCIGSSANVTLNGAVTYTTNPGNINNKYFVVTPTVTTTYSILGASINGCTNTANFQIVVNPLPTVTGSPTICSNQPLNLIANGAGTYVWTGPNGFMSIVQNPVIPNAQPNMTGQYLVVGTSVGGCMVQRFQMYL